MAENPYSILGVNSSDSEDVIKKKYFSLVKKYHPDKGRSEEEKQVYQEKMKKINSAYESICKGETQDPMGGNSSFYDMSGNFKWDSRGGQGGESAFGGIDLGDLFGGSFNINDLFSGGRGGKKTVRPIDGEDLSYDITLSLEDIFNGVKKEINYNKLVACDPCNGYGTKSNAQCTQCRGSGISQRGGFLSQGGVCSYCNGSGIAVGGLCNTCKGQCRVKKRVKIEVSIPKFLKENRFIVSGGGNCGAKGGAVGSLEINCIISSHGDFHLEDNVLICHKSIDFGFSIFGGVLPVRNIDSSTSNLTIPSGVASGETFTLSGKGIYINNYGKRSDMKVILTVRGVKSFVKRLPDLHTILDDLRPSNYMEKDGLKALKEFFDR